MRPSLSVVTHSQRRDASILCMTSKQPAGERCRARSSDGVQLAPERRGRRGAVRCGAAS